MISEIIMFSTVDPLTSFSEVLQSNPVEAVESSALLELIQADRLFYKRFAADDRWRLLFGLGISLLDFSDGIDLDAHYLPLPGGLPSLSLWQICDSLVCVDFQLDGLDWAEELQLIQPLSNALLDACTATLSAPETIERLDNLIREGLIFIDNCDEYPLKACGCGATTQSWLKCIWRSLLSGRSCALSP
jgi:hypothetical protein